MCSLASIFFYKVRLNHKLTNNILYLQVRYDALTDTDYHLIHDKLNLKPPKDFKLGDIQFK